MTWLGGLPLGLAATFGVADAAVAVGGVGEHVGCGGLGFVAGDHVFPAAVAVVGRYEPGVVFGGWEGYAGDFG